MESAQLLSFAPVPPCEDPERAAPNKGKTRVLREAPGSTSGRARMASACGGLLLAGLLFACAGPLLRPGAPAPRGGEGDARAVIVADLVKDCTAGSDNCNVTKCCTEAGHQCYAQDAENLYAKCRPSCAPGPDPTHFDSTPWTCGELGERAAGERSCSEEGENCVHTQCCAQAGTRCYQKDENWATCKAACFPGAPDTSDSDDKPWSCEPLGPFTPGAQGWVWKECAKGTASCADKKCCVEGGAQCYSQTGPAEKPYWAQCKQSCTPGMKANPWEQAWDCHEVGSRTPKAPAQGGLLSPWAVDKCASFGENCLDSKCCLGVDAQCYQKNDKYATCKTHCTEGEDPFDNNETWTCKELGARGHGLAIKGFPSLFCFSLTRSTGYEVLIMQGQLNNSIGIFACDESAVFSSDDVFTVGEGPDGPVRTLKVKPAEIRTTMDGTAGNARLFANVWERFIEDGRWRNHAWTVKADPDAVLMPDRIRWHVSAHTGEKVYVLNCNKFPESPNFPMMFGSVEVFSFKAMEAFSTGYKDCNATMGQWLESWGEDYYMGKCMDQIGVGRISDYTIVGDSVCTGADCNNPGVGAFHAFKSWDAWSMCHQQAVNASDKR